MHSRFDLHRPFQVLPAVNRFSAYGYRFWQINVGIPYAFVFVALHTCMRWYLCMPNKHVWKCAFCDSVCVCGSVMQTNNIINLKADVIVCAFVYTHL